tara:strand:+ start:10780 stop:11025 length:246 start_codon:yes stop_codon:yes gene_type:complete
MRTSLLSFTTNLGILLETSRAYVLTYAKVAQDTGVKVIQAVGDPIWETIFFKTETLWDSWCYDNLSYSLLEYETKLRQARS